MIGLLIAMATFTACISVYLLIVGYVMGLRLHNRVEIAKRDEIEGKRAYRDAIDAVTLPDWMWLKAQG